MSSPIPPLDGSSTPSAPRPRIEIEAAAAPENEFLHLLEASPAASYRVEGDGVFTFFTQQVEQILGYPVAFWFEGGLARWIELMHPDDQGIVAEWEAQGTDDVYAWEYRMRHRDGSWVWVYDQSRVTVDPAGGAVDHGTLLDVTDRRKAELARVGIEREYRELLETAPNAFYRVAVG